jgi:eukaryotic translation initiation factor 2C
MLTADLCKRRELDPIVDHMKDIFGNFADPMLKLVNVETNDDPWYSPLRFLKILLYQQFKKLILEKLTEAILTMNWHDPWQRGNLFGAEGLNKLGIVQKHGLQRLQSV